MSVAAVATGLALLPLPGQALAQTSQLGMFQDDTQMLDAPGPTLHTLRELGVGVVRVTLAWNTVAPAKRPSGFNPVLPASYPAANWSIYDQIVRDAHADGIAVDFSLTGPAPPWAAGGGQPAPGNYGEWKPSATAFGQFVEAVATRYSGSYDPTLGRDRSRRLRRPAASELLGAVERAEFRDGPGAAGDQGLDGAGVCVRVSRPPRRRLARLGTDRARPGHDRDRQPRCPRSERESRPGSSTGPSRQLRGDQAAAVHPHPLLR